MGWLMGIEPTTTGITIRDSTTELQPPPEKTACLNFYISPALRDLMGVPDRNRTCNPQLRRLVLYPVELRAPLKPDFAPREWSGWRDLNSRHPGPKPGALPGYATPRKTVKYTCLARKGQFGSFLLYREDTDETSYWAPSFLLLSLYTRCWADRLSRSIIA